MTQQKFNYSPGHWSRHCRRHWRAAIHSVSIIIIMLHEVVTFGRNTETRCAWHTGTTHLTEIRITLSNCHETRTLLRVALSLTAAARKPVLTYNVHYLPVIIIGQKLWPLDHMPYKIKILCPMWTTVYCTTMLRHVLRSNLITSIFTFVRLSVIRCF